MKEEKKINNESFPFEDDFDEDDFGGLFDEVDDSIYKPSSPRSISRNTFVTNARTSSIWASTVSSTSSNDMWL